MPAPEKVSLKAQIPETLKAELAATSWGKILSVTPVVMTVIATLLAGLASSEMTRAQYDRALAAQRQAKAGDQWSFFQAKKLRGAMQRTTFDLLSTLAEVHPLDFGALQPAPGSTPAGPPALAALRDGTLPKEAASPALPAAVQAALTALETSRSDAEVAKLLAQLGPMDLDDALRVCQDHALTFDDIMKPIGQAIDAWEKNLPAESTAVRRDFAAARLGFNVRRYDAEARLNQVIAGLLELEVRRSNLSAERHHRRSSRFFYGMLAAQLGVIVATLAMAVQRRNLLWTIAALAGAVAIAFTVYVLVYV